MCAIFLSHFVFAVFWRTLVAFGFIFHRDWFCRLYIAKNTRGNIGTVELTCDLEQGKFYEEIISDGVTMKAFRITPKRIRRSNGQVLTPEMSVVVSTNLSNPFNNGAKEVAEAYMRIYGFDYKRSCCYKTDFDCVLLG